MSRNAEELAVKIRQIAGDAPVSVGLILGSGLGHLAGAVEGVAIPYDELEGFPHAGVSGHNPNLVIGNLEGVRVAVFGGRAHYYESGRGDAMRLPLEVLKALGGTTMIATNAAGSMMPDMPTGSIMCLSDHINFSGLNPLIGEQSDARFVPMRDCSPINGFSPLKLIWSDRHMIDPVGMSGTIDPAAFVAIIVVPPSAFSTSSGRRIASPRPDS